MQSNRASKRSEKGQSMVEMAISLIILIMLVVGIADLGRGFFTFITMRDAAQEGATYGSLNPTDTPGIIARVRDSTNSLVNLNDPGVEVYVTLSGSPCHGHGIQVDVLWPEFPVTIPFYGFLSGAQTFPIHAKVTDTILRPPCQ